MRRRTGALSVLALLCFASRARAADVGEIDGAPVRLDVSETSTLKYHFDNRNDASPADVNPDRIDDDYGEWLNHFNVTGAWKRLQAGIRFDTATYFHRPDPASFETLVRQRSADNALALRYRNTYFADTCFSRADNGVGTNCIYLPSKLYVTYASPGLEATVGDAYVALGRGLVLSIRKLDELGADTTVQGGKVVGRVGAFTLTGVVGLSNPVRIDEATGVVLRDPDPNRLTVDGTLPSIDPTQTWARDLIVGGRAEAKFGTSSVGIQAADFHRLADLGLTGDPTLQAKDITNAGASLAVPKVSSALPINAYLELAMQNRSAFVRSDAPRLADTKGYAAYGSLSLTEGIVTTTLEGKHYRGYYPVRVNADPVRFWPFRAVQYMAPPTLELVTQDSLFDNSCTTGGRARVDVKATKSLLTYISAAYFANWGERDPTECTVGPGFGITKTGAVEGGVAKPNPKNDIWDGYVGFELRSQHEASYVLLTAGVRRDTESETGDSFYREGWVQGDFVKVLGGLWSLELNTWQRNRFEVTGVRESWHEGETYLAFKYASKWAFITGYEYTTRRTLVKQGAFLTGEIRGSPIQHFVNFGAQFRFSDAIMLRTFVGQQRGALKCVSGICRQFPNFEGAKMELVITY